MIADAGFDLDLNQREDIDKASQLAADNRINLLVDNPSFEYWILLHFHYTSQHFGKLDDLALALEKELADVDMDIASTCLIRRLGDAMTNAAVLRAEAAQSTKCPRVDFDILVDRLAQYANKVQKKAHIIPSSASGSETAQISSEVVDHATRICWRGLRQRPGQIIAYEMKLYDSVLATIDITMGMDGKRSFNIVDITDNTRLLPLPFANDTTTRGFEAWLKTRTIPQGRDYARDILKRAGVNVGDVFSQIEPGFGLSLTDAYWIAPQGLCWTVHGR